MNSEAPLFLNKNIKILHDNVEYNEVQNSWNVFLRWLLYIKTYMIMWNTMKYRILGMYFLDGFHI